MVLAVYIPILCTSPFSVYPLHSHTYRPYLSTTHHMFVLQHVKQVHAAVQISHYVCACWTCRLHMSWSRWRSSSTRGSRESAQISHKLRSFLYKAKAAWAVIQSKTPCSKLVIVNLQFYLFRSILVVTFQSAIGCKVWGMHIAADPAAMPSAKASIPVLP